MLLPELSAESIATFGAGALIGGLARGKDLQKLFGTAEESNPRITGVPSAY